MLGSFTAHAAVVFRNCEMLLPTCCLNLLSWLKLRLNVVKREKLPWRLRSAPVSLDGLRVKGLGKFTDSTSQFDFFFIF